VDVKNPVRWLPNLFRISPARSLVQTKLKDVTTHLRLTSA